MAKSVDGAAAFGCGRFHNRFLWRTTGFPCEALEQFALGGVASELGQLIALRLTDPRSRHSAWHRKYTGLVGQSLQHDFAASFIELRRRLHQFVCSPRFQTAVALSSPAAAAQLSKEASKPLGPRQSHVKRAELLGMRYLQRFVTKCETAAYVGPVATGSFGPVGNQVEFSHNLSSYSGKAFLGSPFLAAIVNHLRRLPGAIWGSRVKRRTGIALLADQTVVHPRYGKLKLGGPPYALLAAANVWTPVSTLLAEYHGGREEGATAILGLLEIGALSDQLELAFHTRNPIPAIREYAAHNNSPELEVLLDVLENALRRWAGCDAGERQLWLDGVTRTATNAGLQPASRRAGFYADHLPLIEDGFCPEVRLDVDVDWVSPFLSDVETILVRSLAHDAALADAQRRHVARLLAGRTALSLPEFIAAVHDLPPASEAIDIAKAADTPSALSTPAVTSPDVMIAAADLQSLRKRDCTWILSESHSSVACAGFVVRPMPDHRQWLQDIARHLCTELQGVRLVATTAAVRNKTFYMGTLPGISYLETGLAVPADAQTVDLDEFQVSVGNGLQLVLGKSRAPVMLLPGGVSSGEIDPLQYFRSPRFRPMTRTTGREKIGAAIYARARWQVADTGLPAAGADPIEIFAWAQWQRGLLGLPRWIFARPASERKPICIDLFNPFLCEELLRLVRMEPDLCLEEMYPSPDESWVQSSEGHHLCELRLLYASAGTH